MRTNAEFFWGRLAVFAMLACAAGLSANAEEVRVAWSDPSKPGTVMVDLLGGRIAVEGYEGREVIVDAAGDAVERAVRSRSNSKREGLRRIGGSGGGLRVEEQNNVLRITLPQFSDTRLSLRVPMNTSLKLSCINCDSLIASNLAGDIELKNINGSVKATNVSGAVVAHSLNDDIEVSLRTVAPGKAMSFSSMNGDIDVTMPASAKADFVIDTHNGEILTDFEVVLEPNTEREVDDRRAQGGGYKVKVKQNLKGKVNGGGPLMQFKNHNGDILIRKGGA